MAHAFALAENPPTSSQPPITDAALAARLRALGQLLARRHPGRRFSSKPSHGITALPRFSAGGPCLLPRARNARAQGALLGGRAAYRLAAPPAGSTLLFARADGGPWRETDYRNWRRRHFRPAVERLGLPISRPYDLRHTCASLLLHAGWPLTEVAEHLGHSVAVLSDTYAHVIAELRGHKPVPVEVSIDPARRRTGDTKRPQNAPSRPAKRSSRKSRGTKKGPD